LTTEFSHGKIALEARSSVNARNAINGTGTPTVKLPHDLAKAKRRPHQPDQTCPTAPHAGRLLHPRAEAAMSSNGAKKNKNLVVNPLKDRRQRTASTRPG
jgi:hypothetical protein